MVIVLTMFCSFSLLLSIFWFKLFMIDDSSSGTSSILCDCVFDCTTWDCTVIFIYWEDVGCEFINVTVADVVVVAMTVIGRI